MKKITKSQDRQILTACIQAICTLHLCYNFALMLQLCIHVTWKFWGLKWKEMYYKCILTACIQAICTLHLCYNFALMLQLCIHVTWKRTPFQPIRNASFLLAKKLQYCVGGVCFQRHCDPVSVAGIARILGFVNWLDNLNWPLQRVSMFWS